MTDTLARLTGDITQLTDEPWADSPSWAPDGQSVIYLQLVTSNLSKNDCE